MSDWKNVDAFELWCWRLLAKNTPEGNEMHPGPSQDLPHTHSLDDQTEAILYWTIFEKKTI